MSIVLVKQLIKFMDGFIFKIPGIRSSIFRRHHISLSVKLHRLSGCISGRAEELAKEFQENMIQGNCTESCGVRSALMYSYVEISVATTVR